MNVRVISLGLMALLFIVSGVWGSALNDTFEDGALSGFSISTAFGTCPGSVYLRNCSFGYDSTCSLQISIPDNGGICILELSKFFTLDSLYNKSSFKYYLKGPVTFPYGYSGINAYVNNCTSSSCQGKNSSGYVQGLTTSSWDTLDFYADVGYIYESNPLIYALSCPLQSPEQPCALYIDNLAVYNDAVTTTTTTTTSTTSSPPTTNVYVYVYDFCNPENTSMSIDNALVSSPTLFSSVYDAGVGGYLFADAPLGTYNFTALAPGYSNCYVLNQVIDGSYDYNYAIFCNMSCASPDIKSYFLVRSEEVDCSDNNLGSLGGVDFILYPFNESIYPLYGSTDSNGSSYLTDLQYDNYSLSCSKYGFLNYSYNPIDMGLLNSSECLMKPVNCSINTTTTTTIPSGNCIPDPNCDGIDCTGEGCYGLDYGSCLGSIGCLWVTTTSTTSTTSITTTTILTPALVCSNYGYNSAPVPGQTCSIVYINGPGTLACYSCTSSCFNWQIRPVLSCNGNMVVLTSQTCLNNVWVNTSSQNTINCGNISGGGYCAGGYCLPLNTTSNYVPPEYSLVCNNMTGMLLEGHAIPFAMCGLTLPFGVPYTAAFIMLLIVFGVWVVTKHWIPPAMAGTLLFNLEFAFLPQTFRILIPIILAFIVAAVLMYLRWGPKEVKE